PMAEAGIAKPLRDAQLAESGIVASAACAAATGSAATTAQTAVPRASFRIVFLMVGTRVTARAAGEYCTASQLHPCHLRNTLTTTARSEPLAELRRCWSPRPAAIASDSKALLR